MLQQFKKSTFFSIAMLFPYAILLHLGSWLKRVPVANYDQNWFYNQTIGQIHLSYAASTILATLLITVEAILLARISNKFKLNPEGQLFVSICFIILCGLHNSTLQWGPILISNGFLILAFYNILEQHGKKSTAKPVFNFGFLIGMATLFYTPCYIFIVVGVMAITLLRGFSLIELFQMLFGFANVFFLLYTVLYMTESIGDFHSIQLSGYFKSYLIPASFTQKGWVIFSILILLVFVCLSNYFRFKYKKNILVQKQYDIIFWVLLTSFLSIFFMKVKDVNHLLLLITPLSFLTASLLQKIKNTLISEIIHLSFVVFALFLQFQNW